MLFNSLDRDDAYMRQWTVPHCRLFGVKPSPEPMIDINVALGTNISDNEIKILQFLFKKMYLKMASAKW